MRSRRGTRELDSHLDEHQDRPSSKCRLTVEILFVSLQRVKCCFDGCTSSNLRSLQLQQQPQQLQQCVAPLLLIGKRAAASPTRATGLRALQAQLAAPKSGRPEKETGAAPPLRMLCAAIMDTQPAQMTTTVRIQGQASSLERSSLIALRTLKLTPTSFARAQCQAGRW